MLSMYFCLKGDSGGPLVCGPPGTPNRLKAQYGIVSYGRDKCNITVVEQGTYTRANQREIMAWIQSVCDSCLMIEETLPGIVTRMVDDWIDQLRTTLDNIILSLLQDVYI